MFKEIHEQLEMAAMWAARHLLDVIRLWPFCCMRSTCVARTNRVRARVTGRRASEIGHIYWSSILRFRKNIFYSSKINYVLLSMSLSTLTLVLTQPGEITDRFVALAIGQVRR